jgi:hypothetical protein
VIAIRDHRDIDALVARGLHRRCHLDVLFPAQFVVEGLIDDPKMGWYLKEGLGS